MLPVFSLRVPVYSSGFGCNDPRRCPCESRTSRQLVLLRWSGSPKEKLVGSGRREFLEQVGVAATLAVGVSGEPEHALHSWVVPSVRQPWQCVSAGGSYESSRNPSF